MKTEEVLFWITAITVIGGYVFIGYIFFKKVINPSPNKENKK